MSAQLGEWPVFRPKEAPGHIGSRKWWNQKNWLAVTARFNGIAEDDEKPRANFVQTSAQEIQFRKSRFGSGKWYLSGFFFGIRNERGTLGVPDW